MPPPSRSLNNKARDRNRTVAAISGLFALAGLGYYLYTSFGSSNETNSKELGKNIGGSKKKNSSSPRPSLSISLPPTFIRSPTNLKLLESILITLSNQYIITLILPPLHSKYHSSNGNLDGKNPSSELNFEGLDRLSESFQHIEGFDTRRILEYSKEEGRISLARALACDAHCEVMLEESESVQAIEEERDGFSLFDNEGSEDGDETPRAISPASKSSNLNTTLLKGKFPAKDEEIVANLERYHAEVARIRKSSGLLIFLVLPIPKKVSKSKNDLINGNIWSLSAENILKPFLMVGQKDLSARVPGVKIIDCRLAEESRNNHRNQNKSMNGTERNNNIVKAWSDGAKRIAHLANGWS